MKITFIHNKNTSSKGWIYLLPGIGISPQKHICFYWLFFIIDANFGNNHESK